MGVPKSNPVNWLALDHQSTGKNWNIWNFDFLVIGHVWLGFVQKSACALLLPMPNRNCTQCENLSTFPQLTFYVKSI